MARRAQAGGGAAADRGRARGARLAGDRGPGLQAGALTRARRGGAGGRAEGARSRHRGARAGRGAPADRGAQHGKRAPAREDRADRPLGPQAVAVMAGSVSPASGRRHGVARVCTVWDVPRSSFHVARRAAQTPASRRPTDRRRPQAQGPGRRPAGCDPGRPSPARPGRAPVWRGLRRKRRASAGRPPRRTEGPGAAARPGRARASRANGSFG
jgi:hypothetical protein